MHSSVAGDPPQTLIDLITGVLSLILLSALNVRSFVGRWQIIHSKLLSLQASLSSVSDSPHWAHNSLLHNLLPSLLSTLQRLQALSDQCSLPSFAGGKLYMQSDLDMSSAALSNHLNDLDLLLRSGVLHQSNAIVLSQTSAKDDLGFFVKDLFTRLQIGGVEFKNKALESLLQLLNDDEKSACLVVKEGNVGYLISLLDIGNQHLIREQAMFVVSVLASASDESRKIVFEEGGLGPILRVLETGSLPLKERAAIAVEAITADAENAWAIAAYGGVSILIEACRSGSQSTQTHAVGAIRNIATVEDIKMALAEEGAVPVLIQMLVSSSIAAQEKASNSLAILASSGDYFRALIEQEKGLPKLMYLVQNISSLDTLECALRAISSLSVSESGGRTLASSTAFVVRLGEFIKYGNIILQQISASLLGNLLISDGNKRAISSCMGSLVKLMESPKPVGMQEAAAHALVSLLAVRSNRKELVRDEKSAMRLVQMLDPRNAEVSKKLPVMVVSTVLAGGSGGCRKSLLEVGAQKHLQELAEMEVVGAKKALQRLSGNRLKSMFRAWRE